MSDYRPNVQGINAGEVRHAFDLDKLNAYLAETVPRIKLPVEVKQFAHGQSNPTYLMKDAAGTRYVLRRRPPGQLMSSTAHQVDREFNMLNAVAKYNAQLRAKGQETKQVPVPKVLTLCESDDVIGSAFYVMEFLDGRIFTDSRLPEMPKEKRAEYWLELVRVQARLSRVDPADLDLPASYKRSKPFFERQTASIGKLARVQAEAVDIETGEKVGLMPGWEEMEKYLITVLPPKGVKAYGIAHGDLKMDNVIYHPTEPRIIGVIDWELWTIGAPVMDLINGIAAYSIPAYPSQPGSDKDSLGFDGADPTQEGLPSREQLVKVWCEESGTEYPLKDLELLFAWHWWRGAVITQGIAARAARGQASSAMGKWYGLKRFNYTTYAKRWLDRYRESH